MMRCRNCGTMCGAVVALFDPPFCCYACELLYDKRHKND